MGIASDQLGEADWDAVVLVQYPSREIFEALSKTQAYRMALERFSKTYSYGLDRPVLLNLAIPLALGALRIRDLVTRRPARLPFESAASDQLDSVREISDERLSQLDGLRQYSEDAVVVVNLLRGGTRDQRAADRGYGLQMAGLFAEGGHGPTHMGRAVKLEGDAEFDRIALVYYPGVEYMKSMLQSTFFNGIVGGKQPGDTLALPTVPILSRL